MRVIIVRFFPVLLLGTMLFFWKYVTAEQVHLSGDVQTALWIVLALYLIKALSPNIRHIPNA